MKNYAPDLTDDDLKVIKHLTSINNLFKKGNLSIFQLFADNGTLCITKFYSDKEYEIKSYPSIRCDGGDPDRSGDYSILNELTFSDYLHHGND